MPHAAIKLLPGVNQNRTPALNEAAISTSQLIRFIPDDRGVGLVQKLGGWTKWFTSPIGSTIRSLLAWSDTNDIKHLAIGAESELDVVNVQLNGTKSIVNNTPRQTSYPTTAVALSTTLGSNVVKVKIVGSNVTNYDTVWIKTQISVGGFVIFGTYQCYSFDADDFLIYATDTLGNPQYATSTVTNGGSVPGFETVSGSSVVTVTLANHGYAVGDTFPVLISTTVNGVELFGNLIVSTVISSSQFTVGGPNVANATTAGPVYENGGNGSFLLYIGSGALPTGSGYGAYGYGEGGYGVGIAPSSNPGTPITATDWSLDNWGSYLIANPFEGSIYAWNPISNQNTASVIPNAPQVNTGMFVAMPQRQIVAYGSTFNGILDHLLVRWCDVEDFNQWTALTTNQAGSYRIPRGSRIIGGLQAPQQGLLWTDTALWSMQYIGQPYVYSFNEIGVGCGLVAQKACGNLGGVTYWMGKSQFYMLAGSGVQIIYCPVWDVIFQDIDFSNASKIRFAANSLFNEVAWFYPTTGSNGEVAKYVKYNVGLQAWDFGTLTRTAWINQSVLGNPIGASTNGYLYQHETSTDADGAPLVSNFTTGFLTMSEADILTFVDQVWPDMKWGYYGGTQNANVQITFNYQSYPGDTPYTDGPYTVTQATQYITPRFRGRLMSVTLGTSDVGSFWRIGNIRYRLQPDGKFY